MGFLNGLFSGATDGISGIVGNGLKGIDDITHLDLQGTDNDIQGAWDSAQMIPGSPAAMLGGLYQGFNGDLSWNPYGAENSVWDYGAGGSEASQDPRNRAVGRAVGTAIGNYFTAGALSGLTGSTAAGGAASGALWGGAQAAGTGGNVGQGIASGALSGGLSGSNPAGSVGVSNPYAQTIANGVIGGTASAVANGGNVGNGAKQGFLNGIVSAGGSMGNTYLNSLFGPQGNSNPAMNASYGSYGDGTPTYQSPGQSIMQSSGYSPQMTQPGPSQTMLPSVMDNVFGNQQQPSVTPQGLSSFMDKAGDFGANHFGDLAQLAYGLYNNRKQQQQLSNMMSGLQGLYNPNGAYANQLRSNLERQAAMRGTRADVGGREQALMADLAGHNAQLMPAMTQMQNAYGQLQNQRMMNLFGSFKQLGGWNGLRSLFNQQPQQPVFSTSDNTQPVLMNQY